MNILVIGSARHGKDVVAEMIAEQTGLTHLSSSIAALNIFLFDVLNKKYGLKYATKKEAYEDRVNHRDKWYDEITEYNKDDPTRLMRDILNIADIYVGLRSERELKAAIKENVFDFIIGVNDFRKPKEQSNSNTIDILKYSDFIVTNNGTLKELENKIFLLSGMLNSILH